MVAVISGLLLLLPVLLLGGCVSNANYLVKNAKLGDVATVLKDYVGLSGYNMTYSNDPTGAYRIVFNAALVPAGVAERPRRMERQVMSAAIQMTQQGNDVLINAQSTGDVDAGGQVQAFLDFLRGKGYAVEEVKQQ